MKAIYKDIIKFTKTSNKDLIREPVQNNQLVQKFSKEYGLTIAETNIFFIIFSSIVEKESTINAEDIREDFKLSFDEYIKLMSIIEVLRKKGMVVYGEKDVTGTNFHPSLGIDDTLTNKLIFGKDLLDDCELDNPYSIIDYVQTLINQCERGDLSTIKLHNEIEKVLSKADKKLSSIHKIRLYNRVERAILLKVAGEYLKGNSGMLRAQEVAGAIEEQPASRMALFTKILNEKLKIFKDGYVKLDDALFMDNPFIILTNKGANKLFDIKQKKKTKVNPELSHYIKYKNLQSSLFFPKDFQAEISRLQEILKPNRFKKLLQDLKTNNHSNGFVLLFYGSPGTGKTASVYEIAKLTKRDILQVNIDQIRDKFVGESEKRLAQVFEEYKMAKKTLKRTPILLFNEADALIGQRIDVSNSVDQMNNSMQNILLQHLEDFKGICIATTNLIDNIDDAFSRRFLYKLEFPKPNLETRMKIWMTKLPKLDKKIYLTISKYELSGGQIELIAKQFLIRKFLEETQSPQDILERMIHKELSYKSEIVNTMGFLKNSVKNAI